MKTAVLVGLLAVAGLVGARMAVADTLPASPFAAADSDLVLALQAKTALAADPALADVNFTVSVMNRAAVVGGPVPDLGMVPRAEAVLRKVPGLVDVKVSCWVSVPDDPLRKLVADRMKAGPAVPPPPPAVALGAPLAWPGVPSPTTVAPPVVAVRPTPPPDPVQVAADDRRPVGTVTVQRIAPPPTVAAFLLDPIRSGGSGPVSALPMPAPARTVAAPAYPTIPPPAVPTAPADPAAGVGAAVADLRTRDPRFAGLTVELRDTTAVIAGTAGSPTAAWDLAAAVRRVPGIDRVVLGAVASR